MIISWRYKNGCTTFQIQILKEKLKGHNLKSSIYFKKIKNMYVGLIIIYKTFFSFCKMLNTFFYMTKVNFKAYVFLLFLNMFTNI